MKLKKYILPIVTVIITAIAFYFQRNNRNLEIAYNRMQREQKMLETDYEKLYNSYYDYDKKMIKILSFNKPVYWADDSSAYVLLDEEKIFFAFYKKPKITTEAYLWVVSPGYMESAGKPYWKVARVDSLRSHEFVLAPKLTDPKLFMVSDQPPVESVKWEDQTAFSRIIIP